MNTLINTGYGTRSESQGGVSIGLLFAMPKSGSFVMGKCREYKKGEKVGDCFYVREAERLSNYNRRAVFLCKCGNEFETSICNVKSLHTRSCGCIGTAGSNNGSYKHGLRDHPLFTRWADIKKRCYNPKFKYYSHYGGRGITVCDEWKTDFYSFYCYVKALPGYDLNLTIDRIRNNEGYKPGNIRWATYKEQANNRRKRRWHKKPE